MLRRAAGIALILIGFLEAVASYDSFAIIVGMPETTFRTPFSVFGNGSPLYSVSFLFGIILITIGLSFYFEDTWKRASTRVK